MQLFQSIHDVLIDYRWIHKIFIDFIVFIDCALRWTRRHHETNADEQYLCEHLQWRHHGGMHLKHSNKKIRMQRLTPHVTCGPPFRRCRIGPISVSCVTGWWKGAYLNLQAPILFHAFQFVHSSFVNVSQLDIARKIVFYGVSSGTSSTQVLLYSTQFNSTATTNDWKFMSLLFARATLW